MRRRPTACARTPPASFFILNREGPPFALAAALAQDPAPDPFFPLAVWLQNPRHAARWDVYISRSVRRNHPEDYPEYLKGCDIASFDIYPGRPREARDRRQALVRPPRRQAAPRMGQGPEDRADLLAGVTAINKQIRELAPVLNSPTLADGVAVTAPADAPVAAMAKRHGGSAWVFSVAMREQAAKAAFALKDGPREGTAEVLGEARSVPVKDGRFEDGFKPYEVHLYRIR